MDKKNRIQAHSIVQFLTKSNSRIACAESCTGGMLMAILTAIPGASNCFECGFVTYSNESKSRLLGVPSALIDRHGAVSEAVAKTMAEGALVGSRADIAISITGIAGPGTTGKKPEGMVCFALARRNQPTLVESKQFGARGRDAVRQLAVEHALMMIANIIDSC